MSDFSLLKTLKDIPKTVPETTTEAPQYHVYLIESEDGTRKIGVPVENVHSFDAHINANIAVLAEIDALMLEFGAVVLE